MSLSLRRNTKNEQKNPNKCTSSSSHPPSLLSRTSAPSALIPRWLIHSWALSAIRSFMKENTLCEEETPFRSEIQNAPFFFSSICLPPCLTSLSNHSLLRSPVPFSYFRCVVESNRAALLGLRRFFWFSWSPFDMEIKWLHSVSEWLRLRC